MDQGNVVAHFALQRFVSSPTRRLSLPSSGKFQTGLPFDAPERSDRYVLLRMRHGHAAFLGRVLELNVAAVLIDLEPAIILQGLDDVPRRLHLVYLYTLKRRVNKVLTHYYTRKVPFQRRTMTVHSNFCRRCDSFHSRLRHNACGVGYAWMTSHLRCHQNQSP